MRAFLLIAILTSAALAGCVSSDDAPADDSDDLLLSPVALDADGFAAELVSGWTYEMVRVTEGVEVPVTFEVYLPDPATALEAATVPETFPTVLLASPYNGGGIGPDMMQGYLPYDGLFERLLTRGYAIVIGDSGAMGGSGGCWDFMGPDDQAAAVSLVEAVAAQPWSNGKIGMHGLSYDAMTQIMAASNVAEHLTTIVPAAGLTHAYAGLYMGGVHYGGGWWSTTAGYTQSALTPPTVMPDPSHPKNAGYLEGAPEKVPCLAETNAMGNDPTGAYNGFYQERDFRPMAGEVNASVFYIQGFLDAAVKPDNLGTWFQDVETDKKAWLGWWPHTYPTASISGREDMFLTLHRWFDHELMDIPNGIMDEAPIHVQDSLGRWREETAWPPADGVEQPFFLDGGGTLGSEAGSGMATVGGPGTTATSQFGMVQATAFALDAQDEAIHISGNPVLDLEVASDRTGGQLIARLVDQDQDGQALVSQGAFNLMLHDGMEAATPLTPGTPVTVSVPFYPTDYVLEPGHHLVLELYTSQGGWYTADAHDAVLTVFGGDDSVLRLPTVDRGELEPFLVACGPFLQDNADCYDPDREDQGVSKDD